MDYSIVLSGGVRIASGTCWPSFTMPSVSLLFLFEYGVAADGYSVAERVWTRKIVTFEYED